MPIPAASDAARVLAPVRVVTLDGRATVRPVDHDAPERVRARVRAHNDSARTDADVIKYARANMMPAHFRFWRTLYDAIRVMATRDGMDVTPDVADERARNAMQAIVMTFTVAELQPARTNSFEEELP